MFPNKLILQSLVTVPKNLQGYTIATVTSSRIIGHSRANLHCVPSEEHYKSETRKNIINNIIGIGRENQIFRNYSSFSIPLDAYGKVRKVNHITQITETFHLNKTHIKYLQQSLVIRNGNKLFKHKLPQNTIRFITNRSSILPPPSSSGHSKTIEIPEDTGEIPYYKINVKFNGTIPPPTSPNDNIIREHTKVIPETSFNITMSKGRKIRPPSGTVKRCMCSNTINRKLNDFTLLRNKNNMQINLKFLIHTTPYLLDEDKSKSILNVTNITKPNEGTSLHEIYYKQHFPQPFSCPFDKKNRHFMKSYLRPVNLPPPTPKRIKVQSSNSDLTPVYSLEVKSDLTTPSSIKEKSKSPLMDLLEKTKSVVENDPLPALDLNFNTTDGLRNVYESGDEDPKKSIYVKMQGNSFTRDDSYNNAGGNNSNNSNNNNNEQQNMENDTHTELVDIVNEHRKTLDNDKAKFENNPPQEIHYNYQPAQYEDPHAKAMAEKQAALDRNLEEQESAVYTEYPEDGGESSQKEQSPPATVSYQNYMETDNKSNKNDESLQIKLYGPGYSPPNVNNEMSTAAADKSYNKMTDGGETSNRMNFQTAFNQMGTMMNTVSSSDRNEPKYNFHAAAISNALEQEKNNEDIRSAKQEVYDTYKPSETQENKFSFQGPYMNLLSSEANRMEENQDNRMNYSAPSAPSAADIENYENLEKNMMKINFQAADMKTNYGTGSESQYNNDENQASMNQYFDSINRIEEAYHQNYMNQNMANANMMNMGQGSRKADVRNTGKRIMNKLKSMKSSRGLAELAKSFNHSSMFIPKQNLWKKFKFPAPVPSYYNSNDDGSPMTSYDGKNIPKFESFKEAREYFVRPENLKKLTPAQIAMYNSILYYENVVKKHAEEIKRQKDNLDTTQKALKVRKNKLYKNKPKE